jgi:hypothetical protein
MEIKESLKKKQNGELLQTSPQTDDKKEKTLFKIVVSLIQY